VRRRHAPCPASICRLECVCELGQRALTQADLDHFTDQCPHHPLQKAIGFDLIDQPSRRFAARFSRPFGTHHRADSAFALRWCAERSEIMFAEQHGRHFIHGLDIHFTVDVPTCPRIKWMALFGLVHLVAVHPAGSIKAWVKTSRGSLQALGRYIVRQFGVQRVQQCLFAMRPLIFGQIESDDLPGSMNARISPRRAENAERLAGHGRQRLLNGSLYRWNAGGLPLKALVSRAIVSDHCSIPHCCQLQHIIDRQRLNWPLTQPRLASQRLAAESARRALRELIPGAGGAPG